MSRAARTAPTPRIAYNSCRNRHCPKCQGAAAKQWLAEREAELLPVPYFHVVFTLPAPIADIAYQNKAVIYDHPVQGRGRDADHDRRRSQASRRPHRHHRRAAHLGLGAHPSSAPAHDRAGRRHLARRRALGRRAGRASSCPCACSRGCSGACSWRSSPQRMRPAACSFFGDHAPLADAQRLRRLSGAAAQDRVGRLCQAPFAGPEAVLAYLVALHPPRRHRQQPPDRLRRATASPSGGRTTAPRAASGTSAMTLDQRRVHPPLPHPRPAQRLPPHPPLWPVRQGGRADNIARARELLAVPAPKRRSDEPPMPMRRSDWRAAMSVLRRPHDHHRDLRARLQHRGISQRSNEPDQDRHIMTTARHDAENALALFAGARPAS